jgi:hypothetical protein
MRREIKSTKQAALLGGEHDEEDGTFRSNASFGVRVDRKCVSQRDYADRTRAVVIGTVPDLAATDAVMVVVAADQDGFGFELGILPSSKPTTL